MAVGRQLMTILPLAHAADWISGLLALAPVVIIGGMLAVASLRNRRTAGVWPAAEKQASADESAHTLGHGPLRSGSPTDS